MQPTVASGVPIWDAQRLSVEDLLGKRPGTVMARNTVRDDRSRACVYGVPRGEDGDAGNRAYLAVQDGGLGYGLSGPQKVRILEQELFYPRLDHEEAALFGYVGVIHA